MGAKIKLSLIAKCCPSTEGMMALKSHQWRVKFVGPSFTIGCLHGHRGLTSPTGS